MKHRIVDKAAFILVSLKTRITLIYEGPNPAICQFDRNLEPAVVHQLAALPDIKQTGTLSVTDNIAEPRTAGSEVDNWSA